MLKFKESLGSKQKHLQQKINKNINALQKCIQIAFSDKLIIRKLMIDREPKIMSIFDGVQETKSLEEVQLKLKKFLLTLKAATPKNGELANRVARNSSQKQFSFQKKQHYSCQNSKEASPLKEQKKIRLMLDVGEIKRKLKQRERCQTESQDMHIDGKFKIRRNHSQKLSINPQILGAYHKVSSPKNHLNSSKTHFSSSQPILSIKRLSVGNNVFKNSIKEKKSDHQQRLPQASMQLKNLIKRKIKERLKKQQASTQRLVEQPNRLYSNRYKENATNNKMINQHSLANPTNKFTASQNSKQDSKFGKFYEKIKQIMKSGIQSYPKE